MQQGQQHGGRAERKTPPGGPTRTPSTAAAMVGLANSIYVAAELGEGHEVRAGGGADHGEWASLGPILLQGRPPRAGCLLAGPVSHQDRAGFVVHRLKGARTPAHTTGPSRTGPRDRRLAGFRAAPDGVKPGGGRPALDPGSVFFLTASYGHRNTPCFPQQRLTRRLLH